MENNANNKDFKIKTFGSPMQEERRKAFIELLKKCPVPDNELLMNLGLFLIPQTLSRILFMDFLYRQILNVQGIVVEFGCRWGQNLSLFSAFRGIYEPFNRLRKIVGFDTFTGFPSVSPKDGTGGMMDKGSYSVTPDYEQYLNKILELQEQESPLSHLKKYEVIKGDASVCVEAYLKRNPETIIALAYFDLDLYEPTKNCLVAIKDRLTRGSVIGFDELNDHDCPGETLALKEVFGLDYCSVQRFAHNSRASYLIVDRAGEEEV
jgi:predicted GNAT superfamily acetyltransferase